MEEISNKTIAILLISAIIITLGGTLISINKLATMKNIQITGMLGTTNITRGNVTLTINDINWINFSYPRCNWGTGYALKQCTLNTSGYKNSSGCAATFTACSSALEVKNIGNNNCSLNITFKNSSNFIGGANAHLYFKMVNGTKDTPALNPGCRGVQTNMSKFNQRWESVRREGYSNITCDRFYYGASKNTISIHIQVDFDATAKTGLRYNIITATGKPKV